MATSPSRLYQPDTGTRRSAQPRTAEETSHFVFHTARLNYYDAVHDYIDETGRL